MGYLIMREVLTMKKQYVFSRMVSSTGKVVRLKCLC